jgi:hypothetical protein
MLLLATAILPLIFATPVRRQASTTSTSASSSPSPSASTSTAIKYAQVQALSATDQSFQGYLTIVQDANYALHWAVINDVNTK